MEVIAITDKIANVRARDKAGDKVSTGARDVLGKAIRQEEGFTGRRQAADPAV
jgi:hypothetical protein